jgi:hypothetical protein
MDFGELVIPLLSGMAAGLSLLQLGYWLGTRKKRNIGYVEKA